MGKISENNCFVLDFVRYPLGLGEKKIGPAGLLVKRLLDIVFSLLAIIFLLPLFLFFFLAVKITSNGPAIFKQERIGQAGRKFILYKFRTMYADSQTQPEKYFPAKITDKRITPLGKFLRKSFLDEIPQFFNVLKGEMSLVGPRPELEFMTDKYNALERKRLLVKPGMTGPWQIGADRTKFIHENIEYDLDYLERISPWHDLEILAKTFWFLVKSTHSNEK